MAVAELAPETLEATAATIWDNVCQNVKLVLEECQLHGLIGILCIPDPSIEVRIAALKDFDQVCSLIVTSLEGGPDHYSTIRIMINAKQQMLSLELLLNAAKNQDKEGFEKAQKVLAAQATH